MKRLKLFTTTILLLTAAITTHAQTWTQAAKVLASDGAASAQFSKTVDIDGDYAIVGTMNQNGAYIFVKSGTSWIQQQKLFPGSGGASSVAIDGEYAAIGGGQAVYIYKRSGNSWSQQAMLTASDAQSGGGGYFGQGVAIDGEYVIIGAYLDDDKATNAGAAYVFVRSGTTWTEQAKLTANDGAANDYFGYSVAIDGEYAVVGARQHLSVRGAAYVYVRNGTSWSKQSKLLASDGAKDNHFGYCVAIDGDYLIVGAYGNTNPRGTMAGAAYVYVRNGTSWSQQRKLLANDGANSDFFGGTVSIYGDYALVGSFGDDDKGSYSGSAYLYKRSGTSWSQQAKLLANDGQASDYFGLHLAYNEGNIIVGAYGEDEKGSSAGAAYFFSPPACGSTNALPTTAGTTYTGAYKNTDANGWTHYCSSDHKLLLSLDTAGSGAVVESNEVQLKLGASKTTSHGADGGMIKNTDGYILIDRMWDVSPTTQPTGDVGVRYYFTAAEYSAFVTAAGAHKNASNVAKPTTINAVTDMEFYKTSGTAFAMPHTSSSTGTVLTNGSAASTSNWLYAAKGSDHSSEFKVSSFSGGGAGAGANSVPLPVELLSFTAAQADQHTAMLQWTTATEINNNRFDIERSYDGRTFEAIGDVAGNGNSQHQIDYSYTDASVSKVQKTVYYRLKQVDFDGSTEYSDIRVVRFDAVGNDMQFVAYPNPLNNELNVMVGLSNGESYQLEVTNLQGKLVHQENHTYDNGMHKLNTSEWNSGMYILSVATKHATKHMKIVKK